MYGLRRVVVTGLGAVTPLGCGVEPSWSALLESRSGARAITAFETEDLPAKIACCVPKGEEPHAYDPKSVLDVKEARRFGDYIGFALAAAREAIEHSGYDPSDDRARERCGVLFGSGIGGLESIHDNTLALTERGPRRVSPFFVPSSLVNLPAGLIAMRYGLMGPNHAVATACATGTHAIGDAARLIALGDAEVMVAGSTEATVNRLGLSGFAAARALSTSFNDSPAEASRPWDVRRDGFVMGEGAGAVVLEEREHAEKRGATILAEVCGYGLSGDAYHITAPAEDGRGAKLAMKRALDNAEMNVDGLDYINAHGTSTPLGDGVEANAVVGVFGDCARELSMSSTKSSIGHLLGGAGSVEAVFSILAMRDQVAPPTLNLDEPSEDWGIDLVPHRAKQRSINAVMSNSFGFGGTNASVIFRRSN